MSYAMPASFVKPRKLSNLRGLKEIEKQDQFDTCSQTIIPCVRCIVQVAFMACSLTVCGIMLESLLESSSDFVSNAQEATFITNCYAFCKG